MSEADGLAGSESWRSQASGSVRGSGRGSGREGGDSFAEKKDSGSLSRLGMPWRDVADLLRNRSDFSDMEVGPLIGRGSFGRVYKGAQRLTSYSALVTTLLKYFLPGAFPWPGLKVFVGPCRTMERSVCGSEDCGPQ